MAMTMIIVAITSMICGLFIGCVVTALFQDEALSAAITMVLCVITSLSICYAADLI